MSLITDLLQGIEQVGEQVAGSLVAQDAQSHPVPVTEVPAPSAPTTAVDQGIAIAAEAANGQVAQAEHDAASLAADSIAKSVDPARLHDRISALEALVPVISAMAKEMGITL